MNTKTVLHKNFPTAKCTFGEKAHDEKSLQRNVLTTKKILTAEYPSGEVFLR